MSTGSDTVKKWRETTKKRIVDSMGGKCSICNYDKCHDALDLHHIDPLKKELSLGSIRANIKSWDKIAKELRKCILLCCRCHRELHANLIELPKIFNAFDEKFLKL